MPSVRDVLADLLRRKHIPRAGFTASLLVGLEQFLNGLTPGPFWLSVASFALAVGWLVSLARVDWEGAAEEVDD